MISRGLTSRRVSQPSPSDGITRGEKFSSTMSETATSRLYTSTPRGSPKWIETDIFPRSSPWNARGSSAGVVPRSPPMFPTGVRCEPIETPERRCGGPTLITSAPRSAKNIPSNGPAQTCP